jgi:hypothetical protein
MQNILKYRRKRKRERGTER